MSISKKSGAQVFQEERKRVEQGEFLCSLKYPDAISPEFVCVVYVLSERVHHMEEKIN